MPYECHISKFKAVILKKSIIFESNLKPIFMKFRTLNIILSGFLILFTWTSMDGQSSTEEVDLFQSLYGMEKKALISEFLDDTVSDSFWAVYDAYEMERKELGKDRISLLTSYVEDYENLKGDKADELIKKAERLNKQQNSLISRYTKKVRKVVGSDVSAQFYQIEHYLLSATRTEIFENLPVIGEIKN